MKPTRSYEIQMYQDEKGKVPYRNWFEKLKDVAAKQRIAGRLLRLQMGLFGDCKGVGGQVLELRVATGPGYRVYFGLEDNKLILLLCAGDKSSQEKDIALAHKYWNDHKERK